MRGRGCEFEVNWPPPTTAPKALILYKKPATKMSRELHRTGPLPGVKFFRGLSGLRRIATGTRSCASSRQTGILVEVHPVLSKGSEASQSQLPWSEPDGQPTESPQLGRCQARNEQIAQSQKQGGGSEVHGAQPFQRLEIFLAHVGAPDAHCSPRPRARASRMMAITSLNSATSRHAATVFPFLSQSSTCQLFFPIPVSPTARLFCSWRNARRRRNQGGTA